MNSKRRPRVLLRGSWHSINIGDIAHTIGTIKLINTHIPEVDLTLWPKNIEDGVERIVRDRFPNLQIIQEEHEVQSAYQECDFFLHGSAPVLVGQDELQRWREETGKPYGVFGIGFEPRVSQASGSTVADRRDVLTHSEFIFFRESVSLQKAKEDGVECPIMEFGPDGAFSTDVHNDQAADQFLSANGLEHGKFLCCIPRYRLYPLPTGGNYWEVSFPFDPDAPIDPDSQKRNDEMKDHDHAVLREAITRIVRETDLKVLVCPEDITQMSLGKEMIIDKLPDDVRAGVVWKE